MALGGQRCRRYIRYEAPHSRFHRGDIHYEGGASAIARPRDFLRGRPPRASITRAHPWSAPSHTSTRLHESSVTVKSIATRVGIAACPRVPACPRLPSVPRLPPGGREGSKQPDGTPSTAHLTRQTMTFLFFISLPSRERIS